MTGYSHNPYCTAPEARKRLEEAGYTVTDTMGRNFWVEHKGCNVARILSIYAQAQVMNADVLDLLDLATRRKVKLGRPPQYGEDEDQATT